jgi:cell division septation protein DedD
MAQPVVTRTQRRVERKQVVLIVFLILAVAGVSFALGVLFGQQGGSLPGLADDAEKPKLPMVIQVAPPPVASPAAEPPPEKPDDKLTFYENLPKGNQAPLGSGINLPPEEQKPVAASKPKQAVKAAAIPPAPPSKPAAAPAVSPDGAFIVQIASFRTSADAKKLAGRLGSYHLKTYIESVDLGKKGVWHRVLAGPYASRESADQAAGLLQEKERLSALVRQR